MKKRVLVVDDREENCYLLEVLLKHHGFKVDTARNGAEALAKAGQHPPDLIITDILMPVMDGFALCRAWKADNQLNAIPLVFYTSTYTDANDEQFALDLGADAFILKPAEPDVFMARIEAVLGCVAKRAAGVNARANNSQPAALPEAEMLQEYNQVLIHKLEQKLEQLEANAESLRLAAAVFEHTTEGILITDANVNIVAVNPAFTTITGYSLAELLGQNPRVLQSSRHDRAFYRAMWATLKEKGQWHGEVWNRRKNGEIYPELLGITTLRDELGRVVNYLGVFTDIREFKHIQEELSFLAHHDPLTSLPNRHLFGELLDQAVQRAKRSNQPFALLYLDLDHFKPVNDSLGHPVGDQLLIEVAQRLKATLRSIDCVSRIGGDEFNLLLDQLDAPEDASLAAQRLIDAIAQPFEIDGHAIQIGASVGIAIYPRDGEDQASLSRHADSALYQAKADGRSTYRYFTREE